MRKVHIEIKATLEVPAGTMDNMEAIRVAKLVAEASARNMAYFKECTSGKAWVINDTEE